MFDLAIGDIVKDDEARTGVAKEGIYGASKTFMFKIAVALTAITGSMLISMSGFEEMQAPSEEVLFNLRALFIGCQCAGVLVAILLVILPNLA